MSYIPLRRRTQLCLEWIHYCQAIGWKKADLPTLVDVFWLHDGWKTFKGYTR